MARLKWSEQAVEDLDNIAEYIAKDSIVYAKVQVKKIRERARQLIKQPKSGRIVAEYEIQHVREILVGNYRVIYTIEVENEITILTIYHSAILLP